MTETPGGGSRYEPTEPTPGAAGDAAGTQAGDTGRAGETGQPGQASQAGREWLTQLQSMIDNVATAAGPLMRDVAVKAAELAAAAGERAGPIAHRAADATEAAGQKLAERGREVAADLRRDRTGAGGEGAAAGDAPNAIETRPGE